MHIEPLRDLIVVEPEAGKDGATDSGLVVVRSATPPAWYGVVRACGPDVRDVAPGMRVVMSRLQGLEIDGCVLLPEGAVLASWPAREVTDALD